MVTGQLMENFSIEFPVLNYKINLISFKLIMGYFTIAIENWP